VARMLVGSCAVCINNRNMLLTDLRALKLRCRKDACNNQRNITKTERIRCERRNMRTVSSENIQRTDISVDGTRMWPTAAIVTTHGVV